MKNILTQFICLFRPDTNRDWKPRMYSLVLISIICCIGSQSFAQTAYEPIGTQLSGVLPKRPDVSFTSTVSSNWSEGPFNVGILNTLDGLYSFNSAVNLELFSTLSDVGTFTYTIQFAQPIDASLIALAIVDVDRPQITTTISPGGGTATTADFMLHTITNNFLSYDSNTGVAEIFSIPPTNDGGSGLLVGAQGKTLQTISITVFKPSHLGGDHIVCGLSYLPQEQCCNGIDDDFDGIVDNAVCIDPIVYSEGVFTAGDWTRTTVATDCTPGATATFPGGNTLQIGHTINCVGTANTLYRNDQVDINPQNNGLVGNQASLTIAGVYDYVSSSSGSGSNNDLAFRVGVEQGTNQFFIGVPTLTFSDIGGATHPFSITISSTDLMNAGIDVSNPSAIRPVFGIVNSSSAFGVGVTRVGMFDDVVLSWTCPVPEICDNSIDDDGDGDIDCEDSDCPACPIEICGNGIDDDGDGQIDCLDLDCTMPTNYSASTFTDSDWSRTTVATNCTPGSTGVLTGGSTLQVQHTINCIGASHTLYRNDQEDINPQNNNQNTGSLISLTIAGVYDYVSNAMNGSGDDLAFVVGVEQGANRFIIGIPTLTPSDVGGATHPFSTTISSADLMNAGIDVSNPSAIRPVFGIANSNGADGVGLTRVGMFDDVDFTWEFDCPEVCDNGVDDDGDGLVDCADSDCAACISLSLSDPCSCDNSITVGGVTYAQETITITPGLAPYTVTAVTGLYDAFGNLYTTATATAAISGTELIGYVPADNSATYSITIEDANGSDDSIGGGPCNACTEICDNGVDDDGDGDIDCADSDCADCAANCVTPYEMCSGEEWTLVAESNLTNISWYLDGVEQLQLAGQQSITIGGPSTMPVPDLVFNVGDVNEITYTGDDLNACPGGVCCPVVVETISCCDLSPATIVSTCDNQGTSDPTDDTFTFTIEVDELSGTGVSYSISGDYVEAGLSYGTEEGPFGPFLISAGDLTITITDDVDGACQLIDEIVTAPATCSPVCTFNPVIESICNDQGTADPTDDTYSFTVFVPVGEGSIGNGFDISGDFTQAGLAFGVIHGPFGNFLITDGDAAITITDTDDPTCSTAEAVPAPASCSTPCTFDPMLMAMCDDNGTLDQTDDTYTYSILVPSGMGTGSSYSIGGDDSQAGLAYDVVQGPFGPFLISAGDLNITMTDDGDASCNGTVLVVAPSSCSPIPSSIGNFVWHDINANGIQDAGEPGIPNVSVTLTGTDMYGNPVTDNTLTMPSGEYLFDNLVPGSYKLTFGTPAGFAPTDQDQGGNDALDSDANFAMGGMTIFEVLDPGENNLDYDAGFYQPAELGDYTWVDANLNGQQDPGESPLPGVTVVLDGTTGSGETINQTQITDNFGNYLFTNLQPGTYKVTFQTPVGNYQSTTVDVGPDATDSDADPAMGGMTGNYVLESGDSDLTVDAGFFELATIGNFVWEDLNGDGIQDSGEPGVQNVPVTLTGTDELGNPVTLMTLTDVDGEYLFEDLVPGDYKLTFGAPTGYELTGLDEGGDDAEDSDADPAMGGMTVFETLTSGEVNLTYDAGIYRPAELGNYTWIDTNANGVQDPGEMPVGGIQVTLTGTDGLGNPVNDVQLTDPSGLYLFDDLWPGTYKVTFTSLPGYESTSANEGTDDDVDSDADPAMGGMTGDYVLESGDSDLSVDAGYYEYASIGNFVWHDINGNGIQDAGEPGVSNVPVTLTGTDGLGNPVTQTMNTQPDGSYLFDDLVPGEYKITFGEVAGYEFTAANEGGNDAVDSDADPTMGGMTQIEILTSGEENLTYDAGIYQPAELGNYTWIDDNVNGQQDADEQPLPGVTVVLTGTTGSGELVNATAITDANGLYLFDNLAPGTYKVTFESPNATYVQTQVNVGPDATDSDADPAMGGMTGNYVLESGDSDLTVDAGYYEGAAIGNFVWHDLDADGVQDAGEPGISGVEVTLTGTDQFGNPVTETQYTDVDGSYLFTNLVPGEYKLTFMTPAGYDYTSPLDAGGDSVDSDANPSMGGMTVFETLTSGEVNLDYDAGFYGCPEIFVYGLPLAPQCPGAEVGPIQLETVPGAAMISWSGGASIGLADGSGAGPIVEIPAFIATAEGSPTITVTAMLGQCTITETFTITIDDSTNPGFVNCLEDFVVNNDVDQCGANVLWPIPIAVDNCGIETTVTQTVGPASGDYIAITDAPVTVTYEADDGNGNTMTCSFTIDIIDIQLPVLACPSSPQAFGTNGGDCDYDVTGTALDATATDNCAVTSLTHNYAAAPANTSLDGASFPLGSTVVTWTAMDAAGNTVTCSHTIVVSDDDAPTVETACPADIVQANDTGVCGAAVTYTEPTFADNCDGTGLVGTLLEGLASGATFPIGTTTVTYGYTDAAGNSVSCSFDVTVNDTELPEIVCPANIEVDIDGTVTAGVATLVSSGPCGVTLSYTAPVGTDNCSAVTSLAGGQGSAANYYEYGGTYTETWLVTDASGNTATCSFTITVADPVPPVITCPVSITVPNDAGVCGATVTYANPIATDNCPGYTVTQTMGLPSGSVFPLGTTTVAFTITDDMGTTTSCMFDVTVEDTEAPVITTCPAARNLVADASCMAMVPALTGEVVAMDNCSLVGALTVSQSPAAGTAFGGAHGDTQVVVITVTDEAGNSTTCEVILTIEDTTAPTIDCSAIVTAQLADAGACSFTMPGAGFDPTFMDNCAASISHDYILAPNTNTLAGASFEVGTTDVTWTVTDENGNTASCDITITITDDQDPTFVNCPDNMAVNNDVDNCGANVIWSVPVAADNCGVASVVQTVGPAPGNLLPVGTTTITYVATDVNGNTVTCSFEIEVMDMQLPVLACPSSPQAFGTNGGDCDYDVTGTALDATATDNCAVTSLTHNYAAAPLTTTLDGASFPLGSTVVTWTAMDAAGNTVTCSHTIVVSDDDAPTFTCSDALDVACGEEDIAAWAAAIFATATDNCNDNADLTTTYVLFNDISSCGGTINEVYEFTVTDQAGNSTSCLATYTTTDLIAPLIVTAAPDTCFVCSDGNLITSQVLDWLEANGGSMATDECGGTISWTNDFDFVAAEAACGLGVTSTLLVTFTATDECGNSADDEVVVTIKPAEFDLALIKELAPGQPSMVAAGDTVFFAVTVINQGGVIADNLLLSDYVPAQANGFLFDPTIATNMANGWDVTGAISADTLLVQTTLTDFNGNPTLGPGESVSVQIALVVNPAMEAFATLTNVAEISGATDSEGNDREDFDSPMDENPYNDNFYQDNEISGNGTAGEDEDNSDPATVDVGGFDLALIKTIAPGYDAVLSPGDTIAFQLRIINQGAVAADNIGLADYVPDGLVFDEALNPGWVYDAGTMIASDTLSVAAGDLSLGGLQPGEEEVVTLFFIVEPPIYQEYVFNEGVDPMVDGVEPGETIVNAAEITFGTDEFGEEQEDIDSTPDAENGNDGNVEDDEENGTGEDGDDEDDHDIAVITVSCYADAGLPNIIQVCLGCDAAEVVVNFMDALNGSPNVGGTWSDDFGTGVDLSDPENVPISGTLERPGIYEFTYTFPAINDCPERTATLRVEIINIENLTCNGLGNISLGEDCEAEVTPDVILQGSFPCFSSLNVHIIDLNGNDIGNTVTSEHIGQTLEIQLEDPMCDNFCWGLLKVEDKKRPVIECPAPPADDFVCTDADVLLLSEPMTYRVNADGEIVDENGNGQIIGDEIPLALANILDITGYPLVTDNCLSSTVTVSDVITTDGDCGLVTITRTFAAVDDSEYANVAFPCTQTITIRKPTVDDLIFPAAVVEIPCDSDYATLPNGNPTSAEGGVFTINTVFATHVIAGNGSYCNIGASYSDSPVINVCSDGFEFIRTWTVIDWCAPGDAFTFTQLIKVMDNVAPTMTCPTFDNDEDGEIDATVIFSTSPFACTATLQVPMPTNLVDNCSAGIAVTTVIYEAGTDAFVAGIEPGASRIVTGLPIGDYYFHYVAEDACGNQSTLDCPFTVADLIEPTASCVDMLNVSIGGGDTANDIYGEARIFASDVNEGSNDNCGEVTVQVRRNYWANGTCADSEDSWSPWGDFVDFYCCDINQPVTLEMLVTDPSGNTNMCWMTVLPEDKLNPFCYAPEDVTLTCADLPLAFPGDIQTAYDEDFAATSIMMSSIFGGATGTDNCAVDTIVERTPNIQVNDCGWGSITRRFEAWQLRPEGDVNGNGAIDINEVFRSTNSCSQLITITEVHDFVIDFPEDADADCGAPEVPTIITDGIGCDVLSVNIGEPVIFAATGDECYKLSITYDVINWCVWDGEYDGYVISRMTEDDGEALPIDRAVEGNERPVVRYSSAAGLVIDRTHLDRDGNSTLADASPQLPNYGRYIYTQFVKVYDSTAPVVSVGEYGGPTANCPDLLPGQFGDDDGNCEEAVSIPFSVSDECELFDGAGNLVISLVSAELDAFAVDANGDGDIKSNEFVAETGAAGNVLANITDNGDGTYLFTGTFPIITSAMGDNIYHAVRILFEDGCGNQTSETIVFDVIDCKGPAPVCINGLTVTLMPNEGGEGCSMAIWASDFEGSPISDCTGQGPELFGGLPRVTKYAIYRAADVEADPDFVPSPDDTGLVLTDQDDQNTVVYVYAFDEEGNYDYCETYVLVQLHATCSGDETGTIAGVIMTESSEAVEGVEVSINGGMTATMTTNTTGTYSFSNLALGGDYSVTPYLNTNPLNGVTTFDLVKISKHILNVEPLDSPYKLIAADANRSNTVTTLDMIQIRKLILNIITEFPNNTSWRFVAADYDFPESTNPWYETFPELINENNLVGNVLDADFVGVKIGDVNGSAQANALASDDRTLNGIFHLQAEDIDMKAGNTYTVAITAANLNQIEGYQGTLQLSGVELVDIEYGQATAENFGLRYVAEGTITMSWNHNGGGRDGFTSVSHDDVLFSLVLRASTDQPLREALSISSRYTAAEAYRSGELTDLGIEFTNGWNVAAEFALYQNTPNPFEAATLIGFNLPDRQAGLAKDWAVTITISDARGRVLRIIKGDFATGYNSINVTKQMINGTTGVLTYTVEAGDHRATKRMIVVD